jgi:hypothetical protein
VIESKLPVLTREVQTLLSERGGEHNASDR